MKTKPLTAMFLCMILSVLTTGCGKDDGSVFNGEDLTGWQVRGDRQKSRWTVGRATVEPANPRVFTVVEGKGQLINVGLHNNFSRDIYTEEAFGDCRVELEAMIPLESKSGVFLMGRYEVQIADSYGSEDISRYDTMGAIFALAAPKVNAATAPGTWQKFVIDFKAPRFDESGKKTANAVFVQVRLNGKIIHENVEVDAPTGHKDDVLRMEEEPTGPLMLQGKHGSVAFRNIKVNPLPLPANGAFYLLLKVKTDLDSTTVVERLITEHKVAAIPGSTLVLIRGKQDVIQNLYICRSSPAFDRLGHTLLPGV